MTAEHDAAVIARIAAGDGLGGAVYDTTVPGTTRPEKYVLVYCNRGTVHTDRLAGQDRRRRKTYWVHSVGSSKQQAAAVSERVLTQLLNWTPTVTGWTCTRITHEASQPVDVDTTVKPAIYDGVDQFDFYTEPVGA